jgi:hypothetical protein
MSNLNAIKDSKTLERKNIPLIVNFESIQASHDEGKFDFLFDD